MMMVLFGHRLFYLIGSPVSNPKPIESVSQKNIYETKSTRNYYVRVKII